MEFPPLPSPPIHTIFFRNNKWGHLPFFFIHTVEVKKNMTVSDTIKVFCGVQDPTEDLNITEEEYDTLITYYIASVTDWLEYYLDKEYETLPSGLELIVIEMVSNIINNEMQRQDLPVMDTEDAPTQQKIDAVVSEDIMLRLKPYKKKQRITVTGIGTQTQYETLLDIEDDGDIDDVV